MSGKRRLRSGGPRLLDRHDGWRGRAYDRRYRALALEFALNTEHKRLEAGRVCARWVSWLASRKALDAAEAQRELGKGRRPSAREIERLKKREELSDSAYAQARKDLEQLAARSARRPQPEDLIRELRAGGRT